MRCNVFDGSGIDHWSAPPHHIPLFIAFSVLLLFFMLFFAPFLDVPRATTAVRIGRHTLFRAHKTSNDTPNILDAFKRSSALTEAELLLKHWAKKTLLKLSHFMRFKIFSSIFYAPTTTTVARKGQAHFFRAIQVSY
jgi:hypothetical protein